MGFQIATQHTSAFLHVSTTGHLANEDDLLAYGRRVANLCDARDCRRVLLDERRARSTVSFHGRLRVVDELAKELTQLRIQRIACVAEESLRTSQPLEEAARQRGLEYRFFPEPEQAEAWLREEDEGAAEDA
ncbi:MAG: hypothetical protein AAF682_23725 [Planctomycetota bacterium]